MHITGPNNRFLRNSLPLVMLDASAFSNEIGQLPGTGNTIVRLTSSSNNLTVAYNTFTGSGGGPAIDIVSPPFPGGVITRNTISGYPVGIQIAGTTGYELAENVIVNTGIPIDLGGDGPTPNDPAPDADTGANTLQNYPVLTSAIRLQSSLTIRGTLTSTPLAFYRIEIFAGSAAEPEARQFLGMVFASTEADGTATFVGSTDAPPSDDDVIAATAIRQFDTSELSAAIPVVAPGVLSFSPETVIVHEAVGTAMVTVIRRDGSEGTVTVQYSTFSGNATAPDDYLTTSGTLTFGPGMTTQTISIPIVDDDVSEEEEGFRVVLTNPTGGTAILGNDATVFITAHLNAVPTLPVWGLIMLAASLAFLAVRRSV